MGKDDNPIRFFTGYTTRSYPKNQIIYYDGQQSVDTLIITKGYAKIYDISVQGQEKLLIILDPGDILPLFMNFDNVPVRYFIGAHTDLDVAVVLTQDFKDIIAGNPQAADWFLHYTIGKMRQMMSRIATIESTKAKRRLAQVLKHLAEHKGERVKGLPGSYEIKIPLTHQDIANLTGVTRETVSLMLKEMDKDKLISSGDPYLIVHLRSIMNYIDNED